MRGTLTGLPTSHPIVEQLPGLYREDPFTQRFTSAFDDILAGVIQVLDCFPAYLDPGLAPADFLEWVGSWLGAPPDETWPIERRRAFVASASELFRSRGTAAGLAAHVAIFTGGEVEIAEPGAAGWSSDPGAAIPAGSSPDLFIRVRVKHPTSVPLARLEALVAASKPAHLPHRLEVVEE
jgi:phage tail-like protein